EDRMKGRSELAGPQGRTSDRPALDRVTQEHTRQYNNRGKYNVTVTPTVSPLPRNRVDVTIAIVEGDAARIRHINLIGNEVFEEEDILDTRESGERNWVRWYRRHARRSEA